VSLLILVYRLSQSEHESSQRVKSLYRYICVSLLILLCILILACVLILVCVSPFYYVYVAVRILVCASLFYYVYVAVRLLVCVSLSAETSIDVSQSEHEASRRVKSEVLSQMDGINKSLDGEHKLGTQLYSLYWYKSANTDAAGAASHGARNGESTS